MASRVCRYAATGDALSRHSAEQGYGQLNAWLNDVRQAGLYALRRFAQILSRDIEAVRNAIREEWSNGQTEGRINKLKALKLSMYGQAGAELLRARMLPIAA